MKIVIPENDNLTERRVSFLSGDFELSPNVIYQSKYDLNVYIWTNLKASKVYIFIDDELEAFGDEQDAASWIYDNDLERTFGDMKATTLNAVLTIS